MIERVRRGPIGRAVGPLFVDVLSFAAKQLFFSVGVYDKVHFRGIGPQEVA